jgi:hypothetical protein
LQRKFLKICFKLDESIDIRQSWRMKVQAAAMASRSSTWGRRKRPKRTASRN